MLATTISQNSVSRMPRLWPSAVRLQYALYDLYAPEMKLAGSKLGLSETAVEALAIVLSNFDVVPISAELMWQRIPYKSISVYRRMLNTLVSAELMELSPGYGYYLTDAARQAGWRIFDAKHTSLGNATLLPAQNLHEMATVLHRLVHRSRVLPGLTDRRWLMARSPYLRHDAAPLARIAEYLSDLHAFRDDCYLSAWQKMDIGAPAWEMMTLIIKRGVQSLDDLFVCLQNHGYLRTEYSHALDALLARNWLEKRIGDPDQFQLTLLGRQMLEKVDRETDAQFYAPWRALHGHELFKLDGMFTYLMANINGRSAWLPV